MREVKRFDMITGRPEAGAHYAQLYSAALAREAALREELAELGERYSKLQTGEDSMLHRVIAERDAAEQRNAELTDLLTDAPRGVPGFAKWTRRVIAALKPTESGASNG